MIARLAGVGTVAAKVLAMIPLAHGLGNGGIVDPSTVQAFRCPWLSIRQLLKMKASTNTAWALTHFLAFAGFRILYFMTVNPLRNLDISMLLIQ